MVLLKSWAGPTSIVHSKSGTAISSFAYTLDNIGNRTSIATQSGDYQFGYDDDNQVISAVNPEAPQTAQGRAPASYVSESFAYDSIYNRTSDQGGNYTYDSKSQLLQEDYANFYFYDNNGNLTSKQAKGLAGPVTNFEYTSENQLRAFKVFDPAYSSSQPSKEVTYIYDPVGRRISKDVVDHVDSSKSFSRRYVYDGQNILLEYDGSNALLAKYTHSPLAADDILAADITSAGVSAGVAQNTGSIMYLKDGLGSVTDIADSSGNKIQHYVYSAYGRLLAINNVLGADVTANAPVKTAFTFTGRELDQESGNYYYRARYYDPYIGRFLQKDPEPGKLELSVSVVNSYAYVGNNPLNGTDPSGKSFWGDAWSAISNTVKFVGMLALIPAILINPSWYIANVMKTFNLSIPGEALNLIFTGGNWARESSFMGRTTVENSMFAGGVGFTPGPVSFLPSGALDSLRYHEIGHQLQYEKYGGWSFFTQGVSSTWTEKFGNTGPYDTPFECEAGTLSHDTFGLSYYPDTGYSCPARQK